MKMHLKRLKLCVSHGGEYFEGFEIKSLALFIKRF